MIGMRKTGAVVSPLLWAMALAALLLGVAYSASGSRAHAQVPQGDILYFEECTFVTLTVLDSSADYTSYFWTDAAGLTAVSSKASVGTTAFSGEVTGELIVGIDVDDTGYMYKTGPGDRNPDGEVHAQISGVILGFEDIHLDDGPDWDFNDAMLLISTAPCERPELAVLTLSVDPAGTGHGIVTGEGIYSLGSTAHPFASAAGGSVLVGWGGNCSGGAATADVLMDANRHCVARFDSIVVPTPEPTPEPPVVAGAEIGINNTLVSGNPAHVGELVLFRVDVSLENVPAENTSEVYYTYNADELAYVGAAWGDVALDECSLMEAGKISCDFGNVAAGFPFMLHFDALMVATNSTTGATLGADFDGDGAEAAVTAGPANADVDIIDVAGIQLPPLGDGSLVASTSTSGISFQLVALLGVIALGAMTGLGARLRTGSRS